MLNISTVLNGSQNSENFKLVKQLSMLPWWIHSRLYTCQTHKLVCGSRSDYPKLTEVSVEHLDTSKCPISRQG